MHENRFHKRTIFLIAYLGALAIVFGPADWLRATPSVQQGE